MTAAPILSVVVPAYNNERFVEQTVRSILDQDFTDFELVIADHSSADRSWELLQSFAADPRVRLLVTEAGGGAVRNWNRVTEEARGTFLKLVCGDDVLLPGALGRQLELLQTTPGAVLTAAPRRFIDANGTVLIPSRGLGPLREVTDGAAAVRASVRAGTNLFGEPGSVMLRREHLVAEGLWFNEFPYLIDQASYSRVLLHGRFVPDLETGAEFRLSAGQWSVALSKNQAEQARGFHHWLRSEHPDVVSDADVALGNRRAGTMALKRRIAYAVLNRRMR